MGLPKAVFPRMPVLVPVLLPSGHDAALCVLS